MLRLAVVCLLLAASAVASLTAPALAAANTAPQCFGYHWPVPTTAGVAQQLNLQCFDADGDALAVSVLAQPDHGGTVTNLVAGNGGYVTADYTPAEGYTGVEQFTFKGNDGQVDSEPATISVDVESGVPTCTTPELMRIRTGRSMYIAPACSTPEYPLSLTITAEPAHGSLTGDPSSGLVTYVPDPGFSGTDSVSFTVSNSRGASEPVTQQIRVGPTENHAPLCYGYPMSVRAGRTQDATISCNDIDGDKLSYAVDTAGTRGTVVVTPPAFDFASPTLSYTAPAESGADSFKVTATDEMGAASERVTRDITVVDAAVNTAPQCSASVNVEVEAGTAYGTSVQPSCFDAENDPIGYVINIQPTHGTVAVKTETYGGETITWVQYTSTDSGYVGDDTFKIHAVDKPGAGAQPLGSAVITQTMKIVGAKAPTCFGPGPIAVRSGTERMISLPCGAANAGSTGGQITYEIVTQPAHGTLTFPYGTSVGNVNYKAAAGFTGVDTFSFRAKNAVGPSTTFTQRINISPGANTAPDCFGSASWVDEARAGTDHPVWLSCYDADGDTLSYAIVDQSAHGTLTVTNQPDPAQPWSMANLVYHANPGYSGPDSFTFTASDGKTASPLASRKFDVVPADRNTAPLCYGNASKVASNATLAIASFASSCYDGDGDTVSASITTEPQHGTLSAPDEHGVRTYRPDPAFTGTDTIGFKGTDGRDASSEATYSIEVTLASDIHLAPVTTPGGGAVRLQNFVDSHGESQLTVPRGDVAQFDGGCMPLELSTTIASGNDGAIQPDSVKLVLTPAGGGAAERFAMHQDAGGDWVGTIDCAASGAVTVEWVFTDGTGDHAFSKPLGGITLIDPQGVVYDQQRYDTAIAAGKTASEARSLAAIEGATVVLQRLGDDGSWTAVPSGDPGISPNVNPQITGADGVYQWDVAAGTYRVTVTAPGYVAVTSRAVVIPPPVLDLHVAMNHAAGAPITVPGNPGGGSPAAPPAASTPAPATSTPASSAGVPKPAIAPKPASAPSCTKLNGAKKAACERAAALTKALATCAKLKGAKKSTCTKRARALDKCVPLKGAKKASCVKRAKAIGRKR